MKRTSMVFRFHVVIVVLRKAVVHVGIVMRKERDVSNSLSFVVILVVNGAIVLPRSRLGLSKFGHEGT